MARSGKRPTPTIVVEDASVGDAFWDKLRRFARAAGRTVVERALRLYYAAQDPATPPWARRAIYAGLAYFIMDAETLGIAGGFAPPFKVSPMNAAVGIGISALIGVLAGIIPATMASRLRIVDALRRAS